MLYIVTGLTLFFSFLVRVAFNGWVVGGVWHSS